MQLSIRKQQFFRFAVIHIFAAATLFLIFDRMGPLHDMRQVLASGVRTTGIVIGRDCPNHGRIIYQFSTKDGPLTGSTNSSDVHVGDCSSVRLGVVIDMQYLTSAPSKNFAGNIRRNIFDQECFDLFAAIAVAGLFVWGYFRRLVLVDAA